MMDYYCKQKCILIRFMGICSLMVVHGENAFLSQEFLAPILWAATGTNWDQGWIFPWQYQFWYNIQQIYDIIGPVIIIAVGAKNANIHCNHNELAKHAELLCAIRLNSIMWL